MKSETTKQTILTQALKLFSRYGYEAVSVEQIASAVGIKAPSLYKHYRSKRDIFDSVLKRMEEMDSERSKVYQMPEGEIDKVVGAYQDIPVEKIKKYSEALFLHWTEEEFPSCFRKLLTLEQFRDSEMSELYQKYISTGPIEYIKEVFGSMTDKDTDSFGLALEFYGPIYLLYSIYDGNGNKEELVKALLRHIDRFAQSLNLHKKE